MPYAFMSFGGFPGITGRFHPFPGVVLDYDLECESLVVLLDRSAFDGAPSY